MFHTDQVGIQAAAAAHEHALGQRPSAPQWGIFKRQSGRIPPATTVDGAWGEIPSSVGESSAASKRVIRVLISAFPYHY